MAVSVPPLDLPDPAHLPRRGDEVVATGHLSREEPLEAGERLEIGGQLGTVRTIEPLLGEQELRLVLQLVHHRDEPGDEPGSSESGRILRRYSR